MAPEERNAPPRVKTPSERLEREANVARDDSERRERVAAFVVRSETKPTRTQHSVPEQLHFHVGELHPDARMRAGAEGIVDARVPSILGALRREALGVEAVRVRPPLRMTTNATGHHGRQR